MESVDVGQVNELLYGGRGGAREKELMKKEGKKKRSDEVESREE